MGGQMDPQAQMRQQEMQLQNEILQMQQQANQFGSPPPAPAFGSAGGMQGGFEDSDSDSDNDWWHLPAPGVPGPTSATQLGSMPGFPSPGMDSWGQGGQQSQMAQSYGGAQ